MKQHRVWIAAAISLLAGLAIGGWIGSSRSLSPDGLAGRVDQALAITDPIERSIAWHAVLGQAGPDSVAVLRDAVSAAKLDVGDPEVVAFAMWWARFDPREALLWTETEWRAQSRLVVGAIFRVWAQGDPEAAREASVRVAKFHEEAALEAVIVGWQESGRPGLLEWAQSVPDDSARQRFADMLARRLVLALGTEGATRFVEGIADPAFRSAMTIRIASAATEQGEGAAIAAWATPLVTSGEERPSGYPRRIGTRWILRDPEAALAWLESLPAGLDRDDGVMESFRDWMRFAPVAAQRWIQNAEIEPWSEPAFSIYARIISREKPEEALALVARFGDATLRRRMSAVIARKWVARDPAAAKAWLAGSDLPEDVKRLALGGSAAPAEPDRN
jgi:hypothetical protein